MLSRDSWKRFGHGFSFFFFFVLYFVRVIDNASYRSNKPYLYSKGGNIMKKMYIFEVIFVSLLLFIGAVIGLFVFSGIAIVGFLEGKTLIGIVITICSIMLLKAFSGIISEWILDGLKDIKDLED